MKFAVVTFINPDYQVISAVTDPNKMEYCRIHGHDYICNVSKSSRSSIFFDRHRWHLELMDSGKYDWLYCIDADAIFTNMNLKLEDLVTPQDHIVAPLDAIMIQAGGFLINNSIESKLFLKMVILSQRNPPDPHQSDQIEMERLYPNFRHIIRLIPQRKLGSYNYGYYQNLGGNYIPGLDRNGNDGKWQKGDFVFHVPGMPIEMKVGILTEMLKHVVR